MQMLKKDQEKPNNMLSVEKNPEKYMELIF